MPLRGYFLIIGPLLLGVLWLVGWYLDPGQPAPARPAVAAATTTNAKDVVRKPQTTVGVAAPVSATNAPDVSATSAIPAVQDLRSSTALDTSTKPVEASRRADDVKPTRTASHPKKKKHIARRAPREDYTTSGYAYSYGPTPRYSGFPLFGGGYSRW